LKGEFLWCPWHQKSKALGACPKCSRFPCPDLSSVQIQTLERVSGIILELASLSRRKVSNMFFLKQDDTLLLYAGNLEDMPSEVAGKTSEALEVVCCYEQKLVWVKAGAEEKRRKGAKSPGTTLSVVETRDGAHNLHELDPSEPCESISKIYPVKTRFVRRYVPVRIEISEVVPSEKVRRPRKSKGST